MAKRTNRQLIVDRLERATRELENAKLLLMEVGNIYAAGDYDEGTLLVPIVDAIELCRETVYRFRVEIA